MGSGTLSERDVHADAVLRNVISRAISEIESVFEDTKGRFPVSTEAKQKKHSQKEAA
ncbi:hypothetical protein SAMN05661107_1278 [Maritimibacter sp. HL-12]|nr:hypothetical protein SAMN05661107_1278 [Maritimibacter sp. HL-12]